ncbi:hypothetical protein AB1E18_005461 [Capra hircus]
MPSPVSATPRRITSPVSLASTLQSAPTLASSQEGNKRGLGALTQDTLWCFSQLKGTVEIGATEDDEAFLLKI